MDKKTKFQMHREQQQNNHNLNHNVKTWWNGCLKSPIKRMSCGAQRIAKSMSWAHGENWRRKEVKK